VLLLQGAKVILACRDITKAEAALQDIRDNNSLIEHIDAHVMKLDLASFAQIRQFAQEFLSKHPRLDVLINNAGVFMNDLK